MPIDSDLRYQWVRARMAELDVAELRELIESAWTMVGAEERRRRNTWERRTHE